MSDNEKKVLISDINRTMRDISSKLSTLSDVELLALCKAFPHVLY